MYTYQDTFRVSSLLPSATSEISAGPTSAPVVATISNLLIEKFNSDDATGGDAPALDLDGPSTKLDAPLQTLVPMLRQDLGQVRVLRVGADEGFDLLPGLKRPQVGILAPHVLVIGPGVA